MFLKTIHPLGRTGANVACPSPVHVDFRIEQSRRRLARLNHLIQPEQDQRLDVDDATMRNPVLHHKRPGCSANPVSLKICIGPLCSTATVNCPNNDELRDSHGIIGEVNGLHPVRNALSRICENRRQHAARVVFHVLGEHCTHTRKAQNNQLCSSDLGVPTLFAKIVQCRVDRSRDAARHVHIHFASLARRWIFRRTLVC